MTTPDFLHIDPRLVLPSATNPRKHFDPVKLQELADSIAASGVHQPVLLRPLPAARVPDTVGLKPRPTHEMVAGERRLRASLKAGVATIPAMVQDLTDAQVLEIQIVENLQRDDLSPLEEAEGYRYLIDHTGVNAQEVGAKIGKSRAYVYGRLKLLDLCPEGRAALAEGKLEASTALLVARIPDSKLQAEATAVLTEVDYTGDAAYSHRAAAVYIQEHYQLRLESAKFDRASATLVPAAGACSACPHRTGANPDLFSDVKNADVCTLPSCYHAKEQAHVDAQLQAARDSGAEIIEGREAKLLMPHRWSRKVEGHLRLDDAEDSPTKEPLRKVLAKVMEEQGVKPTLIANPHVDGEMIAVISGEQATALLHAAGQLNAAEKVKGDAAAEAKAAEREAALKAEDKVEQGWRNAGLQAVIDKADAAGSQDGRPALAPTLSELLRHIARHYLKLLRLDQCKALASRLNLGKVAPRDGIEHWLGDHAQPVDALIILVGASDAQWVRADADKVGANHGLYRAAAAMGVDLPKIAIAARDEARADADAKAKAAQKPKPADVPKGDLPLAPAARRKRDASADAEGPATRRGRGAKAKPAIGEAQARESIAAAMQAQEPDPGAAAAAQNDGARPVLRPATPSGGAAPGLAIGQQVKVLANATGAGQKRWVGKTGQVVSQMGDSAWDVEFAAKRKGLPTVQCAFDVSELEVV
ncbi:ParB/RepB/Spo0J family partition protein [Ottowia flava]|uniref:ParB/RepB/Spo0J family partition protein n=1 Tax=Ottowia flava TaxID=2675430 RepID=A0ABW4KMT1_9BURK|nr:ParB/RepB/Spo0J family partition protein [Ottowia sp. GY511]